MTFIYFILLGIIQGVTEFLPISSTAHLNIIPKMLGLAVPASEINVFLNLGSLAAIFVYFRKEIEFLFIGFLDTVKSIQKPQNTHNRYHFISIFLASLPTIIFFGIIEIFFAGQPAPQTLSSISLIVFGIILYICDRKDDSKNHRPIRRDAILTGLAQLLSIIPGVSRLGSCLSALRLLGYSRYESFKFSMILSIPPVLGACLLKFAKICYAPANLDVELLLAGVASAFAFGLLSLHFITRFLKNHTLTIIVIYRIIFGLISWNQ